MKKEQIISLIRHVLSGVGGILIAKGLASEEIVLNVLGAALTLVGIVWSVFDKTFDINKLEGGLRQVLTTLGLFIAFFNPSMVEQILGFLAGISAIILGQTAKVKTPAEGAENK